MTHILETSNLGDLEFNENTHIRHMTLGFTDDVDGILFAIRWGSANPRCNKKVFSLYGQELINERVIAENDDNPLLTRP